MVVTREPATPETMSHADRARLRLAASAARRRYPGPVGEVLAREIAAWEEFGYRFGGERLIGQLVEDLLSQPREHAG